MEEKEKIDKTLLFRTTICSISMLMLTFCLFCYYTGSFCAQVASAILQLEDNDKVPSSKVHTFFVALSLVPALMLGAFQLHILRMVQNQGIDKIYSLVCTGRYLQVPISCFVAGTYMIGAVVVFFYSLLIQDWEAQADEWRSKALVYLPAGVMGGLFLLQLRSLMKTFEDPFIGETASLLSGARRRFAYQGSSFQLPQQYQIRQPQVELTVRRETENPQFAYCID